MRRAFFFVLTNLAVLLVLNISLRVLGVDRILSHRGLDLWALSIFALLWGMTGSMISLLLSKWLALQGTGAVIIEQPRNRTEAWLLSVVASQAEAAGIGCPDVAIYESSDANAFATGANPHNALVAVSTGLLETMTSDEVEAVLGHEVSHIANGDMITLTLLQGVLNAFVIFLARIIGFFVDAALSGQNREDDSYSGPGPAYWLVSVIAELVFGVLASVIVMWFSRQREYRADAGGADLAGSEKMIRALQRLQMLSSESSLPASLSAFGISGRAALSQLFMSHPPLSDRIAALRERGTNRLFRD